ncbi:MAG TPA: hypothetical protein VGM73_01120 [Candidatus Didemnitutus sp.]|jgi:hypothetical protein
MRLVPLAAMVGLLALTADVPARAADAAPAKSWGTISFTRGLSGDDVEAAGLTKLTADQVTFLNSVVGREVDLARAGGVTGFAGTFSSRRTAVERTRAGLDLLTDAERARLDLLVAQAIVAGPVVTALDGPRKNRVVALVDRLQIHGEVSLTFGSSGHGRNFYGTSFFTTITDPATNLTIGIGFDQYHGKGLPYCDYLPAAEYLGPGWNLPIRAVTAGQDYLERH